jgi:RNA polymerase sigma-70 factor (ECF subfamily)
MADETTRLEFWIGRLAAGDPAARAALLETACDRLRRLTRKMLRDDGRVRRWEQTDDVLQNALLRLTRALQEVTPRSAAEFLRLAACHVRRELIDLARHYYGPQGPGAHHATPDTEAARRLAEGPAAAAEEPGQLAAWQAFHEAIAALPEADRQLFDLLWYQGLSQPEAARLLGLSERTLKRRWQAARLALHRALRGEHPGA